MTEPTPLYSGEAILKRWGDSSSGGRTVTFQIDGEGPHPLKGYEGERFMVVCVPIGNDDKPMTKCVADAGAVIVGGDNSSTYTPAPRPTKPKRHWRDMPPSQRAALLVKDEQFREWIRITADLGWPVDEEYAIKEVRAHCGVESRSMITPGSNADMQLSAMEGCFQAWRQAKGHGQI